MDFYWMKLGDSNCLADYWLNTEDSKEKLKRDNILGGPAVAIYFGKTKSEDLKELVSIPREDQKEISDFIESRNWEPDTKKHIKKHLNEIYDFFTAIENKDISRLFVFNNQKLHILEATGDVGPLSEDERGPYDKDIENTLGITNADEEIRNKQSKGLLCSFSIPKYAHCKIRGEIKLEKIPHILATLPNNQGYNRKTCRKLKEFGHIQAVRWVRKHIEKAGEDPKEPKDALQFMKCLSPLESETLLFLNLHERRLHCPAWRGGTTKGIDIVAHNLTSDDISIGDAPVVGISKDNAKSFQVKWKRDVKHNVNGPADYTLCLSKSNDSDQEKTLDAKWLLKCTKENDHCEEWLFQSLKWLGWDKDTFRRQIRLLQD